MMGLAILFGLLLAFVHFFSDKIHITYSKHRMKTMSFSAGIFITYILLHLFPRLYQGVEYLTRLSFISVLVGFSLFHVVEKYIYKHAPRKCFDQIVLSFFKAN